MAETEVESILREIRERVLSEQHASRIAAGTTTRRDLTSGGNGAGASAIDSLQRDASFAGETLALLNSYLTTTARAWDRLPPLVSNRSGFSARLELWLKRRLRSGTRWFTWEQVNFNAAVHHALRDILPLLLAYQQELEKLRAQIEAEAAARRIDLEQHQVELTALRVELRGELEAHLAETNDRLADLVRELRERDEHLREEQRTCYKQLALESSEGAVLEDRARRKTEALLEELTQRLERLEKK
jgi:hypothetical protein